MKNLRLILWFSLFFVAFQIYQQWQLDHAPKVDPKTQTSNVITPAASTAANNVNIAANGSNSATQELIKVKTDVLDIKISPLGGDIVSAGLITFPKSLLEKDQPFHLLDNNELFFVSQTGFLAREGDLSSLHSKATFVAEQKNYQLDNQDSLVVTLTSNDVNGLVVTKKYTFKKGSFEIGFEQTLQNNTGKTWVGSEYRQLAQKPLQTKASFLGGTSSYIGGVVSAPDQDVIYRKIKFDEFKSSVAKAAETNQDSLNKIKNTKGGWVALLQHYFIASWIPDQNEVNNFYVNMQDGTYFLGLNSALVNVEANQTQTFKSKLYLGPKVVESLAKAAPKLELTVDFGPLSFISDLMLNILRFFHNIVGNWGWSIMLLTLTVKACLFYFADRGYRSMAKMKKFTPELTRIKELYPDDAAKRNQAMMELYRKEKINPMSGCWPMLIQIPIFLALFWMLSETVEIRQMPWILWIKDLSVQDPYYILPIIMGGTMFIQQKLNPAPADPMQAKVMMYMPIVFTFMFLWFPAGLVIYWITNNTLSILQQSFINKRIEKMDKKSA